MTDLKKMSNREIIIEIQKVCDLSKPSLLKLTKADLIKMYGQFSEKTPKEVVKERKGSKRTSRLLDFSSDEDAEDTPKSEVVVKPRVKAVKVKKAPVKVVKIQEPETIPEPEPERESDVSEEEIIPEPVVKRIEKPRPPSHKKKVKEVKAIIKVILIAFKDSVTNAIMDYKNTDDTDYLIDSFNELKIETEGDISDVLDENVTRTSNTLIDWIEGLINVQQRRVQRMID